VAAVHQRAVIVSMLVPSSSNRHVSLLGRGIIVHHNTPVYNNRNQVELRLGMNIAVHKPYTIDHFPNYTTLHQQKSPSIIVP
jgi:hypothetical protein